MITIDGSKGEGGGQILRSALALAMVTGQPFRIDNIRAGRRRPGLLRQHLTAVKAAAEVSRAKTSEAAVGVTSLTFTPGDIRAGDYRFAVGTAGSATLVFQTILPALILADGPSRVTVEGGTHNEAAPPFDFLERAFLPLLNEMGPAVSVTLQRHGFYPAGGGCFTAEITPTKTLAPIELMDRGAETCRRSEALFANLPADIAKRELATVRAALDFAEDDLKMRGVYDSPGPGNVLLLTFAFERVTEMFTGFGRQGVSAEAVANQTVKDAKRYLATSAAVGRHLADQLLLPMALAGGGRFTTLKPTQHTRTNVDVIQRFLDIEIAIDPVDDAVWQISLNR